MVLLRQPVDRDPVPNWLQDLREGVCLWHITEMQGDRARTWRNSQEGALGSRAATWARTSQAPETSAALCASAPVRMPAQGQGDAAIPNLPLRGSLNSTSDTCHPAWTPFGYQQQHSVLSQC